MSLFSPFEQNFHFKIHLWTCQKCLIWISRLNFYFTGNIGTTTKNKLNDRWNSSKISKSWDLLEENWLRLRGEGEGEEVGEGEGNIQPLLKTS